MFPVKDARSLEAWVTNQFGFRLYSIFFKTYTEKVWGMSCKDISADWAAQRIKGLSLTTAILNAVLPKKSRKGGEVIKTLIDSFRYPRKGPGMMWEACARNIVQLGGALEMGCRVTGCEYDSARQRWKVSYRDVNGVRHDMEASNVISSAPMRELVNGLAPRMSAESISAANSLKYRDFLTVVLILKDKDAF